MIKYLLCFLLVASSVLAKPKPTPKPTPSKTPTDLVCRTKQKDLELRDWIDGVLNELHKAQADLIAAQKSNGEVQTKLDVAKSDATKLANECASDHQCAVAPLSCWFHRLMKHLLWIAGAAVLLIIGLLVASFFFPALGPILGFFVSIWKWFLGLLSKLWPSPPKV